MVIHKQLIALIVAWTFATGCSGMVDTFGELFEIRDAVAEQVDAKNIGVNLNNGSFLTISIVNPTDLPESDEERRARFDALVRTLEFDEGVESVSIAVVNRQSIGCFHSQSFKSYGPWQIADGQVVLTADAPRDIAEEVQQIIDEAMEPVAPRSAEDADVTSYAP